MRRTAEMSKDPVWGYSNPDTRWSRTNVDEAAPDILSPLCWSVWGETMEISSRRFLNRFGVISKAEMAFPQDQNLRAIGVMYGRLLMNVTTQRELNGRIPGIDADDWERELMGSVREDAEPVKTNPLRLPYMIAKTLRTLGSATSDVEAIYPTVRQWWTDDVFDVFEGARSTSKTPIERLHEAHEKFREAFCAHVIVRIQLEVIRTAVAKAAEKTGKSELAQPAISGQADLPEIVMAEDLGRLGRGEMQEREFLRKYGFHGPNEGNVFTQSWRENPERLRQLAKTAAKRSAEVSAQRRVETARGSQAAREELLAAASGLNRRRLRGNLDKASASIRALELGKRSYLMALDGIRAGARAVGEELVAQDRIDNVDDVFFFELTEIDRLVAGGLPDARELVAQRREARELYKRMTFPGLTIGMPPYEELLDQAGAEADGLITGADSGGGVVEGRARIVTDPNDDVDFEDGDVLVCRFTDPGWAPIFPLVEALVIDLGTSASHGAIVAREMGMTYVIGAKDATTRIEEGARIRVDGTANAVTVL